MISIFRISSILGMNQLFNNWGYFVADIHFHITYSTIKINILVNIKCFKSTVNCFCSEMFLKFFPKYSEKWRNNVLKNYWKILGVVPVKTSLGYHTKFEGSHQNTDRKSGLQWISVIYREKNLIKDFYELVEERDVGVHYRGYSTAHISGLLFNYCMKEEKNSQNIQKWILMNKKKNNFNVWVISFPSHFAVKTFMKSQTKICFCIALHSIDNNNWVNSLFNKFWALFPSVRSSGLKSSQIGSKIIFSTFFSSTPD